MTARARGGFTALARVTSLTSPTRQASRRRARRSWSCAWSNQDRSSSLTSSSATTRASAGCLRMHRFTWRSTCDQVRRKSLKSIAELLETGSDDGFDLSQVEGGDVVDDAGSGK